MTSLLPRLLKHPISFIAATWVCEQLKERVPELIDVIKPMVPLAGATLLGTGAGLALTVLAKIIEFKHDDHADKQAADEHENELAEKANQDRLSNHHLARAVGLTLSDIVKSLPTETFAECKGVDKLIEELPTLMVQTANVPLAPLHLIDEELPQRLRDATEGKLETGDVDSWFDLIRELATGQGRRIVLTAPAMRAIAVACHKTFLQRFFNTIKTDSSRGGGALASVQLRMMGETLRLGEASKKNAELLEHIAGGFASISQDIHERVSLELRTQLKPLVASLKTIDDIAFAVWLIKEQFDEIKQRPVGLDDLFRRFNSTPLDYEEWTIDRFSFDRGVDKLRGHEPLFDRIRRECLDAKTIDGLPRKFAWCTLTGPAGSGKNRLAWELCKSLKTNGWPASGFLEKEYITPESAQLIAALIETPTILLVDDASSHPQLNNFVQRLAERIADRFESNCRVRLILLDRLESDARMIEVISNQHAAVRPNRLPPHTLRPPELSEADLLAIIRDRAGNTRFSKSFSDWQLRRVLAEFDELSTPLTAAMIGYLIKQGEITPSDVRDVHDEQGRSTLCQRFLNHERERWSQRARAGNTDEGAKNLYEQVRTILALATFCQGIEFDRLRKLCTDPAFGPETLDYIGNFERLIEFASSISGHDTASTEQFASIRPDLIAEQFVLDETSEAFKDLGGVDQRRRARWLRKVAWREDPDAASIVARQCFQDFPERTAAANFLLPSEAVEVRSEVLARLIRNLASDRCQFCEQGPISDSELRRAFQLSNLLQRQIVKLREESVNAAVVRRNLAVALFQLMQLLGRAINPLLPLEVLAAEETVGQTRWARRGKHDVQGMFQAATGTRAKKSRGSRVEIATQTLDHLDSLFAMCNELLEHWQVIDDEAFSWLARAQASYAATALWEERDEPKTDGLAVAPLTDTHRRQREQLLATALQIVSEASTTPSRRSAALRIIAMTFYAQLRKGTTTALDPAVQALMLRLVNQPQELALERNADQPFFAICRNLAINAVYGTDSTIAGRQLLEVLDIASRAPFDRSTLHARCISNWIVVWDCVMVFLTNAKQPDLPAETLLDQCLADSIVAGEQITSVADRHHLGLSMVAATRRHAPKRSTQVWDFLERAAGTTPWPSEALATFHFGRVLQVAATESTVPADQLRRCLDAIAFVTKPPTPKPWTAPLRAAQVWETLGNESPFSMEGLDLAADMLLRAADSVVVDLENTRVDYSLAKFLVYLAFHQQGERVPELMSQIWRTGADPVSQVRRSAVYQTIAVLDVMPLPVLSDAFRGLLLQSATIQESPLLAAFRERALSASLQPLYGHGDFSKYVDRVAADGKDARMEFAATRQFDLDVQKLLVERIAMLSQMKRVELMMSHFEMLWRIYARTESSIPAELFEMMGKTLSADDPRWTMVKRLQEAVQQQAPVPAESETTEETSPMDEASRHGLMRHLLPTVIWPLEPLYSADWQPCGGEDAEELLARVYTTFGTDSRFAKLRKRGIAAIRVHEPSFYETTQVAELLLTDDPDAPGPALSMVVLVEDQKLVWFVGQSDAIHLTNRGGVNLSSDALASDYLHFFCGMVHGEAGAFLILESLEQLRSHVRMEEAESERIWQTCPPLTVQRAELESKREAWTAKATVLYSDTLFETEFLVTQSTGMVEMTEDNELIGGLDARPIVFGSDGYRQIKTNDVPDESK